MDARRRPQVVDGLNVKKKTAPFSVCHKNNYIGLIFDGVQDYIQVKLDKQADKQTDKQTNRTTNRQTKQNLKQHTCY